MGGGSMKVSDFGRFSGSLTADVPEFNPDAIPAPDTLVIRMTRGEHHVADELRKQFGGFRRVVIDVDGDEISFSADSLIRLLEGYEGTSNWHKLFGTPERAAKTVSAMCSHGIWSCDGCPLFDEGVEHCESELGDTPSLLEWLRGEA